MVVFVFGFGCLRADFASALAHVEAERLPVWTACVQDSMNFEGRFIFSTNLPLDSGNVLASVCGFARDLVTCLDCRRVHMVSFGFRVGLPARPKYTHGSTL